MDGYGRERNIAGASGVGTVVVVVAPYFFVRLIWGSLTIELCKDNRNWRNLLRTSTHLLL